MTKYTPQTLLSQRKLALTARKQFLSYKIIVQLKKFKKRPRLGLKLTIHVIKSQLHLVRQSL
jgi:hypothetical protein